MQMRIANRKHIVTASTAHEYMRIWNAMRMNGGAKHANAANSRAARAPQSRRIIAYPATTSAHDAAADIRRYATTGSPNTSRTRLSSM